MIPGDASGLADALASSLVLAILLPPSEGKAPDGTGPGWEPDSGRFGSRLASERTVVAEALAAADGGSSKLLGVKEGPTLDRARQVNTALVGAPTLPAWRRFTGVVWDHFDPGGFTAAERRKLSRRVFVISALAGVSALDDPLPDFRLKLSVSLDPMGKLSTWWSPTLSEVLNDRLAGRQVVDLLPQEHRAAWQPDADRYTLQRVTLVRPDGSNAGHHAKAGKGLLTRALLESDDAGRTLATWRHPDLRVRVD
jgi:cytoplasmic iron level regulating protein YaaA (DUF328/UPF0246 family)